MFFLKRLYILFCLIPGLLFAGDFDLGIKAQYRREQLHWKVNDNTLLNNLSEAKWNNIQVPEIKGFLILRPFDNYLGDPWLSTTFIKLEGGCIVGTVKNPFNGTYIESAENIVFPNASSKKFTTHGDDFTVSAGCELFWYQDWSFNLEIGYSNQHRRFHSSPGDFTSISPAAGFIESLSLSRLNYRARWEGPWIGLHTVYDACCPWILTTGLEYHRSNFHGNGHWIVQEQLVSGFSQNNNIEISQRGVFHGVKALVGLEYAFTNIIHVGCNVEYEYFWKSSSSGSTNQTETFFDPAGVMINQVISGSDAKYNVLWNALAVSLILNLVF